MFNQQLYNTPFHEVDLSKYCFLVTGGAGFIGSNLVEYLLRYNAGHVRVLDNLSNGYLDNIKAFIGLSNFEFIEGDIREIETCRKAVEGIHFITHQAALGSVPRSIADPITSNEVNISGFLNMLVAAKDSPSLKQMVYAASSSTYGDSPILPKIEGNEGNPLSPYAVTKLVNEIYADVFSRVYGFHTIGLRYFNVFGPKQSPDNAYAAVIPLFMKAGSQGVSPKIYGDGETSRDFTFVENAVQANIKAMLNMVKLSNNEVYNIAIGQRTTLNELWQMIANLLNIPTINPEYLTERSGDVRHSLANITKARTDLGYDPQIGVNDGIALLINYFKQKS
jgi:UDP-N-acetylglucosamine 4-epimerase